MKALSFALVLVATACAVSSASAAPPVPVRHGPAILGGNITVPPEWAGIWQSTDSTYDCNGVLKSVSTSLDTLCAGVTFYQDPSFTCTGTADADSYFQHCTGGGEIFTDCNYSFDLVSHGTRSGDTFFGVSVFQTSYSGTGKGCDLFTPSCQQINSHTTRTGPAPAEYCASPTLPSSWGSLKSRYR